MADWLVKAVRLNRDGALTQVRYQEVQGPGRVFVGSEHEGAPAALAKAMLQGDIVGSRFMTLVGYTFGPNFSLIVVPGGRFTIDLPDTGLRNQTLYHYERF